MKIVTKKVEKKGVHLGWKVYIDGEKFPKKPQDYYTFIKEDIAIGIAINEAKMEKLKL
jgi:hypothetical protein